MSWRRARLTFWSSNCQNGRKKKNIPKGRDIFYFFQCMEKLIDKDKVFYWRQFCVHLVLCSQLLLPACSDQEGRRSSARAVAAQCDSCHSRSSCLLSHWVTSSPLCEAVGLAWDMGTDLPSRESWQEGGRKCCILFCVSRIRPMQNHSLSGKGQKAGTRNKSNVWEQSPQASDTKLVDRHTTVGGSVGSFGNWLPVILWRYLWHTPKFKQFVSLLLIWEPKPCVRARKSAERSSGASLPGESFLGARLQTDLSPFEEQDSRVVFSIPLEQLCVQRHFSIFFFPLIAICVVANTEGNVRKTEGNPNCHVWLGTVPLVQSALQTARLLQLKVSSVFLIFSWFGRIHIFMHQWQMYAFTQIEWKSLGLVMFSNLGRRGNVFASHLIKSYI